MIRRKMLTAVCTALLAVTVTGCSLPFSGGSDGDDASKPETVTESEPEGTKPASEGAAADNGQGLKPVPDKPEDTDAPRPERPEEAEPEADHYYTFTDTIRPHAEYEGEQGVDDYSYDVKYDLYAMDDGSAKLNIEYEYTPARRSTENYEGRWEENGESVDFIYEAVNDNDSSASYSFTIKRGKVESVKYFYYDSQIAQAAGSYTCDDPEYGLITLDVNKNGSAVMTMGDGTVYNGSISSTDTRYNFYCFDDEGNMLIDWYVDCSVNGSFRHSPFSSETHVNFAGLYKCTGMAGDFEMTIEEDGSASAVITVDGQAMTFTGNAYGKYTDGGVDNNTIGDVYLNSEEGYSMSIELTYMWDIKKWNYYGTLTKPLAAG